MKCTFMPESRTTCSTGRSNSAWPRSTVSRGDAGLLPVEQFMREYFRLTDGVSHVVQRFIANSRPGPRWGEWLAPLFSHQFERDFRIGPTQINANRAGWPNSKETWNRSCDWPTWRISTTSRLVTPPARRSAPRRPAFLTSSRAEPPIGSSRSCRGRRGWPRFCGECTKWAYSTRSFRPLVMRRCLLQFNEYHKYTVDEHCLRAVEIATQFQSDPGPLGSVYRRLRRKWLLHLALLLHDLGKGYAEDHSEVGLRIARETSQRLGLSEDDTETLCFLVHKHLLMAHLAFRRDTSDNQLVVRFAVEVGSPEAMQMLFVLTAADMSAVGPGVLNAWKIEVLADLHRRAMQHLAGEAPALASEEWLRRSPRRGARLRGSFRPPGLVRKATAGCRPPICWQAAVGTGRGTRTFVLRWTHGDVLALGRYQEETGSHRIQGGHVRVRHAGRIPQARWGSGAQRAANPVGRNPYAGRRTDL